MMRGDPWGLIHKKNMMDILAAMRWLIISTAKG